MTSWAKPELPFNPLTAPADAPLRAAEIYAGPFGLLAFIPLVPLVRLAARRWPRAALLVSGLVWVLATAGPGTLAVTLVYVAVAVGLLDGLARLRGRGSLSEPAMVAAVWVGLSLLTLPLWWVANWPWYGWGGSRLAPLHHAGFAYFYLRLIAWGVSLARDPAQPRRWVETFCWLAYAPCMRLGPVVLRESFLERFERWEPRRPVAWKTALRRAGLFLLGATALGVTIHNTPHPLAAAGDFYSAPQEYDINSLLRVFYLVPLQVYLLLWTYNELACALSHWLGLPVDDNFRWLPAATSVRDFWRRWHITVGAWLRNYIYIPLGGSRRRTVLNIATVFVFCGLWHGPAWSYLAWGATQTIALIAQRMWDHVRRDREPTRWGTAVAWLATMHYQAATIVIFTDFAHGGMRFLPELGRRLVGLAG